jgi:RNA polymerase-associated protein
MQTEQAQHLVESLTASVDVFSAMPYFLSESYSVLDATLAPLLWRLPSYGIVLPEAAAPIMDYAKRLFSRAGFAASLSPREKEMGASIQSTHVTPRFSA